MSSSYSTIVMQGFMMKKKGTASSSASSVDQSSATNNNSGGSPSKNKKKRRSIFKRSICLKWVTRYFILFDDGRLVYYKDRPAYIRIGNANDDAKNSKSVKGEEGTLLCTNISKCTIDRVLPEEHDDDDNDMVGNTTSNSCLGVANSFFVTQKPNSNSTTNAANSRTLLVTNGPEEYKQWILAFRKMKASVMDSMLLLSREEDVMIPAEDDDIVASTSLAIENGNGGNGVVHESASTSAAVGVGVANQAETLNEAEEEDAARLEKERLATEAIAAAERLRLENEELERLAEEEAVEEERQRLVDVKRAEWERKALEKLRLEKERLEKEKEKEAAEKLEKEQLKEEKERAMEKKEMDKVFEEYEVLAVVGQEEAVAKEEEDVASTAIGGVCAIENGTNASGEIDNENENDEGIHETVIERKDVDGGGGDVDTYIERKEAEEDTVTLALGELDMNDEAVEAVNEDNDTGADEKLERSEQFGGILSKVDDGNTIVVATSSEIDLNDTKDESTNNGDGDVEKDDGEDGEGPSLEAEVDDEKTTPNQGQASAVVAEVVVEDLFSKMTMDEISTKAQIFAYGNTFDEFEASLDSNKVLFGIFVTSLEEMMPSTTLQESTTSTTSTATAAATCFSLEYEGDNAQYEKVTKFKNHLHEIQSFCRKHTTVSFDRIHPLVYSASGVTKGQMLKRLGASESEEGNIIDKEKGNVEKKIDAETKGESPPHSFKASFNNNDNNKQIEQDESINKVRDSIYLNTEKTSYQRALEVFDGTDNMPSGNDILKIIRQSMGFPYNWVLFEPSRTDLIVKDAGSGGVMEITKLLQENSYNDCLLFGLLRLSFASEFGRRQFWVGLDWKGENCSSVKAMRQLRECVDPMTKMIGDRSFTVSNATASEMTLEMFVDRVTRSCNVTDFNVTVDTMKNAHVEEQKAIRKYEEERMEKERLERERMEEELRERMEKEEEVLSVRREKIERLHESRRLRWSKMSATEILQDLGSIKNDDVSCGWVLLEF